MARSPQRRCSVESVSSYQRFGVFLILGIWSTAQTETHSIYLGHAIRMAQCPRFQVISPEQSPDTELIHLQRETAYGFSSPVSYPSDYFISSQARLYGLGGVHLSVINTVLDYGLFGLIIREDFLLTGSQTAATWFGTHCSTGQPETCSIPLPRVGMTGTQPHA